MNHGGDTVIDYRRRDFAPEDFPFTREPAWAARVERWNQLDPPAFALVQAYWEWRAAGDALGVPRLVVLASPGASNATDQAFVRSGAVSPSRFAHTLPNTRGTALLQAMGWSGRLLCLQKGESTLTAGLIEGLYARKSAAAAAVAVWVLGVATRSSGVSVFGFFLHRFDSPASYPAELDPMRGRTAAGSHSVARFAGDERDTGRENSDTASPVTDVELRRWLETTTAPRAPLRLDDRLALYEPANPRRKL